MKVYDVYSPFSDPVVGIGKEVVQWQIFSIFFVVLLVHEGTITGWSNAELSSLFFVILFANLFMDVCLVCGYSFGFEPVVSSKYHSKDSVSNFDLRKMYALDTRTTSVVELAPVNHPLSPLFPSACSL